MKWLKKIFGINTDKPKQVEPEITSKDLDTIEPEGSKPVVKPKSTRKPKYNISLRDAFKNKYPDWMQVLDMFEQANKCSADWDKITKLSLQRYMDYLAGQLAPNSVHQYAARFKAVLNLYSEEVKLPRDFAKMLTPRKTPTTSIFLTDSELAKLIAYAPKNDFETVCRNLFIISAYTGCRFSDAIKLDESNIRDNEISYVSQKTKISATIPLKSIVAEYIRTMPEIGVTEQGYNKAIKRICRNVGICDNVKIFKAGKDQEGEKWQFASTHTARKSFASNLYLHGVDLYTISRYLGHTDTKMTEHYIVPQSRELSESQMAFFN